MKNCFLLATLFWGMAFPLFAQLDSAPDQLYCLWESVNLREGPGKSSKSIGIIRFGEVVSWYGLSEYVADESRTYLKVQAVDGAVGWVHEYLFVKGIGLGVVLQGGLIYKRPKTVTTVTTDQFMPGDLVVVESYSENWVGLAGKQKQKRGWIEGRNKVSMADQDILFASLMMSLEQEKDPAKRQKQMELVRQQAAQSGSPMAQVIQYRQNPDQPMPAVSANAVAMNTPAPDRSQPLTSRSPDRPMPVAETNNRYSRSVADPETGQIRQETVETGSIYLVNGPANAQSVYFAYHKSLPKGSYIRIQIPGTHGYVELKVVDRLRADNPAIIGLHPDCVQAIFGDYVPREISITYPPASTRP